ncbi:MAG: Rrf2 family transcriptional regulator [Cytophagales bacterium]|nr:Rrf2 family transcriptional regulator [Cytophagales bacterium]
MFSRACEYAIKIMIYIASNQQENRKTGLKEVTEAIGSPEAFTAKILQQLVKSGLLESYKGPSGGFLLSQREVKLRDIVATIDGNKLMEKCVLGFDECGSENPCPVHDKFALVRRQINETLLSIDVRDQSLGQKLVDK